MNYYYNQNLVNDWRLEELETIISDIENDFIKYVSCQKIVAERNYLNLMLDSCGKAILTMRELLLLCTFGYPDGAMGLARNLYEQMIILSFFNCHKEDEKFCEYVNDYFLDSDIDRENLIKADYESSGCDDKIEEVIERIRKLEQSKYSQIKGQYWWAKVSRFAELKDAVIANKEEWLRAHFQKMHIAYKMACSTLHAGCSGNSFRLSSEEYGITSTLPSFDKLGLPLWFAVCSLVEIFEISCLQLEIDYATNGERLLDLQEFYREKMREK